MVLYLKNEKAGRTDKDAVDIGGPPVAVQGEVVIGGAIVAQSRREKMGSEDLLAPDSAPVGSIAGAMRGRDEKGDHRGDDAGYDDERRRLWQFQRVEESGRPRLRQRRPQGSFSLFSEDNQKRRPLSRVYPGHTLRGAVTKVKKSRKNPLKSSRSLTLAA